MFFTIGTLVFESFFNKVPGLQTPTQVFSCEICKIFRNTFFNRTTPMAASEAPKLLIDRYVRIKIGVTEIKICEKIFFNTTKAFPDLLSQRE